MLLDLPDRPERDSLELTNKRFFPLPLLIKEMSRTSLG